MKFHRQLVSVLPGQGFRSWWFNTETKKAESRPLVGFAVYRAEVYGPHECEEGDGCECSEDESTTVHPLLLGWEGYVEEFESIQKHAEWYGIVLGILPEGESFTDEQAATAQERIEKAAEDRREREARRAKEAAP
jgi:hypothetical protein